MNNILKTGNGWFTKGNTLRKGVVLSDEIKKKISLTKTGKKHNKETLTKMKLRNNAENGRLGGIKGSHSKWTGPNNKEDRIKFGKIASKCMIKRLTSGIRCKPTKPEIKMKELLDSLKIKHFSQHPLHERFVVDEWLPDYNTVVEVDGIYWHNLPKQIKRDCARNAYLTKCGHRVIRVWENHISSFSKSLLCKEQLLIKI